MADQLWLRMGDLAEYKGFPTPHDAGIFVGQSLGDKGPLVFNYRPAGVAIPPIFAGNNYISLFWGDKEAQWLRDLNDAEKKQFEAGVRGNKPQSKPKREDCTVDSWEERDRLGIWITHTPTGKTIAEWWDDEARQMFEDGFFKPGVPQRSQDKPSREFIDSVFNYAKEMGMIE